MRLTAAPLAALGLLASGCDEAPGASVSPTWACPAEWVSTALGGCGPAAVLCAPGGGAATGACERADGGAAFNALPDGAVAGPWREPEQPGGAPLRAWRPDAGLGACPEGWARDAAGTCAPVVPRCDAASEPVPGGACVPSPSPSCAEVAAPRDLPRGAVALYVRADAPPVGADGSLTHPFPTLAGALAAAPDGAWVLVAPGRYRERVVVRGRSLHLRGSCWEQTVIETPDALAPWTALVSGEGASLDLADLTLRGDRGGLGADGGASLRAARLRIDPSAAAAGVYVGGAGTRAALDEVLVRDVGPYDAQRYGVGVRVDDGATATLRAVAIVRATRIGLAVLGAGSRVEGALVVVRDVREEGAALQLHAGVLAFDGGSAVLRRAVVRDAVSSGVTAEGAGARVELEASLVADTRPRDASGARGLYAVRGGAVVARRVSVRGDGAGAYALHVGSSVTLEDAEVSGAGRGGVVAAQGATATLTRVEVTRCGSVGVAFNADARGSVRDVIVRDTAAGGGGRGHGLECFRCEALAASGVLAEGNHEAGVLVFGAGARLSLDHATVRGTLPRGDGYFGVGLAAGEGATLLADGVRLEGNHQVSALAQGASLSFRDGWILDTRAAAGGGDGVAASFGGEASVERSVIQGAVQSGAIASGGGATLRLTGVAVRDVTARATDGGGGWGVSAQRGGRVVAAGVLVERATRTGFQAYGDGARAELTDVLVTGVTGAADGFGGGIAAFDRGQVLGARVAVLGARGAAVAAAAIEREEGAVPGAAVRVDDLFVRDVRPSTVDAFLARAPAVSYGAFAGRGCALDLTRATLFEADWGFFHSAGSLTLRRALIARQRRGAGAASLVDATHPLRLEEVALRANASDAIQRDIDLPTLRIPPPPEPALPRLTP